MQSRSLLLARKGNSSSLRNITRSLITSELRSFNNPSDSEERDDDFVHIDGLRPFHKDTTDLIYTRKPLETVVEYAKATGKNDIKFVTTGLIQDSRSLLHSSLNEIQNVLRSDITDEVERGGIIADKASEIVSNTQERYDEALKSGKHPQMLLTLDEKLNETYNFVNSMIEFQGDKKWNAQAFDKAFPLDERRERYQNNSIKIYRKINEQMSNGDYTSPSGKSAGEITQEYMADNIIYKHFRRIGCLLAGEYLEENTQDSEKLTDYPADKRKGIIVCGPMSSGKTEISKSSQCADVIHQNADYIKPALWEAAVKDGAIDNDTNLALTQNESSIVVYESGIKRCHNFRTKGVAPNVLVNSICANESDVQEFLNGGRKVEVHHISVSPNQAVSESNQRAIGTNRKPPEDAIKQSNNDSAKSILNLTKFKGKEVQAFLYERTNENPILNSVIDFKKQQVDVYDKKAFMNTISRARLADNKGESALLALDKLIKEGFTINYKLKHLRPESVISFDDDLIEETHLDKVQNSRSNYQAILR